MLGPFNVEVPAPLPGLSFAGESFSFPLGDPEEEGAAPVAAAFPPFRALNGTFAGGLGELAKPLTLFFLVSLGFLLTGNAVPLPILVAALPDPPTFSGGEPEAELPMLLAFSTDVRCETASAFVVDGVPIGGDGFVDGRVSDFPGTFLGGVAVVGLSFMDPPPIPPTGLSRAASGLEAAAKAFAVFSLLGGGGRGLVGDFGDEPPALLPVSNTALSRLISEAIVCKSAINGLCSSLNERWKTGGLG